MKIFAIPPLSLAIVILALFSLSAAGPAISACDDEAEPQVNWANCDFTGKDFKNKDLSNSVLTGATFDNADFSGAMLENTDFNFANLENARFDGARMSNTRLVSVKAQGASFKNAVLDNSRLSRASLNQANFTGVRADNINFYDAELVSALFVFDAGKGWYTFVKKSFEIDPTPVAELIEIVDIWNDGNEGTAFIDYLLTKVEDAFAYGVNPK